MEDLESLVVKLRRRLEEASQETLQVSVKQKTCHTHYLCSLVIFFPLVWVCFDGPRKTRFGRFWPNWLNFQ